MLFDIHRRRWDEELCGLLGVDPARLPEPLPSASIFGTTAEFGGEVPVAGDRRRPAGGALRTGLPASRAAPRTPTGPAASSCSTPASARPRPPTGLLTTLACATEERAAYALEASIFVTGAAVQWLRDGLGMIDEAAETEALAASLEGNDGVYFVPALTGLGSPHWDPYARGTIVGLTRGSGRAHLARAALEAIAYQTVDAVRAQEEASGERLAALKADGGAVANAWLMQFQADVLGAAVVVPEIAETTALGAAYLAGISTGIWSREQVAEMWREAARYEPRMGEDERARAARRLAAGAGALARLGGSGGRRGRNRRLRQGVRSDCRFPAGNPAMAEIKPQTYKDDRPAEYFDEFHEAARKGSAGPTPSCAS